MIHQIDQTALVQSIIQNMQMMHNHMHQNYTTGHHGQGRGRGHGHGRDGCGITHSGDGSYCHTHGNCNHLGANFRTPRENHNTTATFNNMLGGSATHCFWITPKLQYGSDIVNN